VAANVSGRVTATYVERGMPVKAGQVLAVVDSKAALASRRRRPWPSRRPRRRRSRWPSRNATAPTPSSARAPSPKSEYDRLKSQCTAQLYNANAAQANADLAGKLAGDTVIRAPIDGIIGERYVNVGEYVQPPTRVASVYSVNPARVSISVPEPAVGW
jgi:membrane fusion protein (multidrug efflux system)